MFCFQQFSIKLWIWKKNEHLADLAFGIGHLNGKFMVYLVSAGLVTIPDQFENKKQRQWQ